MSFDKFSLVLLSPRSHLLLFHSLLSNVLGHPSVVHLRIFLKPRSLGDKVDFSCDVRKVTSCMLITCGVLDTSLQTWDVVAWISIRIGAHIGLWGIAFGFRSIVVAV